MSEEKDAVLDGAIHAWFGLTYSAYLCVPRLALQEQPAEWQVRFVALMDEMQERIAYTPVYSCMRRDEHGRYIQDDPWRNYRRGTVAGALAEDRARGLSKEDWIDAEQSGEGGPNRPAS